MTRTLAILALILAAAEPAAQPDPAKPEAAAPSTVPGVILVQTARSGATATPSGKDAKPQALKPGETIAANGQVMDMPANSAVGLIFSNGNSMYFPLGGRLTLGEFMQAPVVDTAHDGRDYEPSRSVMRLTLPQGTLVASGRKPVPTSTFALTTPLARFDCLSPAFIVRVDADSVSFSLLEGTAEVTVPETGFHETLQAGQTATLTRQNLKANYPLKLVSISTADNQKFNTWLAATSTAERRVTFTGVPGRLKPSTLIPQEVTQQMSVDDPRFRQ